MMPPEYQHPLYRPATITRLSTDDAAAAILAAVIAVTGKEPPVEALEILVAQSALETADWVKIYNWNFGNSKSTQQWPHTYFRTGERDPKTSRTVMYDPPHVNRDPEHVRQTRFRAFDSAAQGAEHHLRLLVGRYQLAYEHAMAGRMVEFSRALYERGYYTGASADPVKWYTDALVRRSKSLDARLIAHVALEVHAAYGHLKGNP